MKVASSLKKSMQWIRVVPKSSSSEVVEIAEITTKCPRFTLKEAYLANFSKSSGGVIDILE